MLLEVFLKSAILGDRIHRICVDGKAIQRERVDGALEMVMTRKACRGDSNIFHRDLK